MNDHPNRDKIPATQESEGESAYSQSHQDAAVVDNYQKIYAGFQSGFKLVDRFSYARWQIEQEEVKRFLHQQKTISSEAKCMDFACGTGRWTRLLAGFFDRVDGVDISENMLEIARTEVPSASFYCRDITAEDELCEPGVYDYVFAFRFFLRAEDRLRNAVFAGLRREMKTGACLVFNVHDSRKSLNWPLYAYARLTRRESPTANAYDLGVRRHLEHGEVQQLLSIHGFEIEEVARIGWVPNYLYGLPLFYRFFHFLDRMVYRLRLPNFFPIERIYYCRAI